MATDIARHDQRVRRCPMLGHEVPFSYCRAPASRLPCRKIFDCWWEIFDIKSFVHKLYSSEDIEQILVPREEKVFTLVELVEKARRAAKDSPNQKS